MAPIYKVAGEAEWAKAVDAGCYRGSPDDRRDGYIHFSTAAQLPGTLARYFAGRDDLVLVAFESAQLGPALKWEPARDGSLFPHLYAELDPQLAIHSDRLALGADGRHVLPEGVR